MIRPRTTSYQCLAGTDAWSRTAERIRGLAARSGQLLDDDALLLNDVRDLQRLALRIESRARRTRR